MIAALHGIVASKASGGSGPVLLQSIGIKFDNSIRPEVPANWNISRKSDTNNDFLINLDSDTTGIKLVWLSGNYADEPEGVQNDPFGRFPSGVLGQMVYLGASPIEFKVNGLGPTKSYAWRFAAVQYYDGIEDTTEAIINGVAYNLGGPYLNNVVYPTADINFPFVSDPAGEATLTFNGIYGASGYACINAAILEEYSN